jgi:hypothetical protein
MVWYGRVMIKNICPAAIKMSGCCEKTIFTIFAISPNRNSHAYQKPLKFLLENL